MKRLLVVLLALLTVAFLATGCQKEEAAPYQFKSSELGNYVIVYDGDNPDYFDLAYRLNDQIYTKYGVILTTVMDTNSTPAQYEILLGDTNRCEEQGKVMEYSVTIGDGKFRINTGGSYSAEKAVDLLCEQVFNGREFVYDSGEYCQTSLLTDAQAVAEGTSARVMSANLLADAFADASYQKAYYRAEIFAGMLLSYTPDVLGLQETDESWNAVLDTYLEKLQKAHGIAYTRHLAEYQDKVNYTSLLYRSDKFRVEDSGVNVFSWWTNGAFNHNYHMRNVSWAQFSSLEQPDKTFVLANTHWSYRTEHANGSTCLAGSSTPIAENELRVQCKDETDAFMSTLRQSHPDMPIFLTGDFNTSLPFFTDSGWTPASFRVISEEALGNGTAMSTVPESGHFDHIFGTGSYSINRYAFFNNTNQHSLLTDHPFVYADLVF